MIDGALEVNADEPGAEDNAAEIITGRTDDAGLEIPEALCAEEITVEVEAARDEEDSGPENGTEEICPDEIVCDE